MRSVRSNSIGSVVPVFLLAENRLLLSLIHIFRGSFVGTRQDMAEALAFAVGGKVKADIELQPLSLIHI